MSLSSIDAINAELVRRHAGLTVGIGWKARSAHSSPPSVMWIPDQASFDAAMPRRDRITAPLLGRTLRFKVECWGTNPDETQRLAKSVVRVALRTLTLGSCDVQGEEWTGLEGSGGAILGELATVTLAIRDDVEDDNETTVAPPTTTTVGGGYA